MNEVLAEIKLSNLYTDSIYISKSFDVYRREGDMPDEVAENLLFEPKSQGFVWYPDFIAFDMLGEERNYWVKLTVAEALEIDSTLTENMESQYVYSKESVIVLPFEVVKGDRLYLFGGDDDLVLSFTLSIGHYQLLFQNRLFTREEIEASPNNDCQDLDYDYGECDYIPELCQLTFIPTDKVIEPKILVDKNSTAKTKSPSPLILFDHKLNNSN